VLKAPVAIRRSETSLLVEIYLKVVPCEIGFIKSIFESYECVGIIRTIDRHRGIIVVMVPRDFADDAWEILDSIRGQMEWREVPRPENFDDDWLMRKIHEEDA
jgi:hypothetical protein